MSRGKHILSMLEKQPEENDLRKDICKDFSQSLPNTRKLFENPGQDYLVDIQNVASIWKSAAKTEYSGHTARYMSAIPSTSKDMAVEDESSSTHNVITLGSKSPALTERGYNSEDVLSGSECIPGSNDDDSDNEPLSNILKKQAHIHQSFGTPEHQLPVHVTADSDILLPNVNPVFEEKRQKVKKKIFETNEKTSRVRARNPDNWKKRKSAVARQKGEEYMSQTGKVMPKKTITLGSLCKANCRLVCSDKFNNEDRELILKKYYSLDENSKTALLFNSIAIFPVKRHKVAARKQKIFSFRYSISFKQKTESICRDAICSLYQFSRKKVERIQNMLKQGKNAPTPDKRGHHLNRPHKIKEEVLTCIINHIKKFPAEESHYSRNKNCHKKYLSPLLNMAQMHKMYLEECEENKLDDYFKVKQSMYTHIFSNKFNLSFGQPRSDTCSVCDSGQNSEIHTENYKAAFNAQKRDREKPISEKNTCFITMDLQQTMPLPKLTTSKAFYLRQMWLYNFGIHCITAKGPKPFFFNWTEDVANRGSLEIASCLFRFCELLKEEYEVDHLIIWSDSCAGQNKNFTMICLYQLLILNETFKIIDHKYPEVGHSYLDSDRNFGRIEKKLRKCENIYVPEQYRDIIKAASNKNSVCLNMENYFLAFNELSARLHMYNKKTNALNEKVNFRDNVKWVRVDEFGSYLYKDNLHEMLPFQKVDLLKKGSRIVTKEDNIKVERIAGKMGGLTTEKLSNLREQMVFVKEPYKWFYERILEENEENPKKKRKTN